MKTTLRVLLVGFLGLIIGSASVLAQPKANCPVVLGEKIELDPFNKFTWNDFKKMTRVERIQVLRAYQEFFLSYEADPIIPYDTDYEETQASAPVPVVDPVTSIFGLFSDADATPPKPIRKASTTPDSSAFDCYYAGWPSKIAKSANGHTYCQSPLKGNSTSYLKDEALKSCKGSSLLCNPALFGDGLCAVQSTQKNRDNSFKNCIAAFDGAKRDIGDLADQILKNPAMEKLYNQMSTNVNGVCLPTASSFQKGTYTCRSLIKRLEVVEAEIKKRTGHVLIGKGDVKPSTQAVAGSPAGKPSDKPKVDIAEEVAKRAPVPDLPVRLPNGAAVGRKKGGGNTAAGGGAFTAKTPQANQVHQQSGLPFGSTLSGNNGASTETMTGTSAAAAGTAGNSVVTTNSTVASNPGVAGAGANSGSSQGASSDVTDVSLGASSGGMSVGQAIRCYHALSDAMGANVQKNYPANILVLPSDSNSAAKAAIKFTTDSSASSEQVEVCNNTAGVEASGGYFYSDTSAFQSCNIDNRNPSAPRKILSSFLQTYTKLMVERTQDPNAITESQWLALYLANNPADQSPSPESMAAFKASYRFQVFDPRQAMGALEVCSKVDGDEAFKDTIASSMNIVGDKIKALAKMVVPGGSSRLPGGVRADLECTKSGS